MIYDGAMKAPSLLAHAVANREMHRTRNGAGSISVSARFESLESRRENERSRDMKSLGVVFPIMVASKRSDCHDGIGWLDKGMSAPDSAVGRILKARPNVSDSNDGQDHCDGCRDGCAGNVRAAGKRGRNRIFSSLIWHHAAIVAMREYFRN